MKKTFGLILMMWSLIFARLETQHFGNNWLPQSNEELICDLTALIIVIAGIILFWQKNK